MENKYYTPSINEFHPGFEFELLEHTHDEPYGTWTESIYGNLLINKTGGMFSTDLKIALEWIKEEEVRVKYLDREDIESLGWAYVPDTSQGDGNFRWFDEFSFGHYVFSYWGKLDDPNWQKESLRGLIMWAKSEMQFRGYIKNKSELKRLMVQLGILADGEVQG